MNSFTWIFLAALTAHFLLEYWLLKRQALSIRRHRAQVPEAFAQKFTLSEHQKAADYNLANVRYEKASLLFSVLLLLVWTFGGGLDYLQQLWAQLHGSPLIQGTGLIVSVLIISTLLEIPLALWRTFGIEQRFGFNRSSKRQFIIDQVLQLMLMLLIGIPLMMAILWLLLNSGTYWWLWAWGVWTGFTLFISWAYPTLIAPLFNKFQPLEDKLLRTRLEHLLIANGFKPDGIFVMDGSKRSAHGNAYFTGLGKNKRIVFFDTLLEQLDQDQIVAVLAHELGHFKRHHIRKMMLMMSLSSLLGMALLGWLIDQPWFYTGLGVSQPSPAMGLTLFLLVIPVFASFFTPLFSALSRRHEFEADAYAAHITSATDLISALLKMYRDNASTLTPDPLYSAFHHSHPPASERIRHLSTRIEATVPMEAAS